MELEILVVYPLITSIKGIQMNIRTGIKMMNKLNQAIYAK
jgi:hypothetical protein